MKPYPSNIQPTLESIANALQFICRTRSDDITEFNNLDKKFMSGNVVPDKTNPDVAAIGDYLKSSDASSLYLKSSDASSLYAAISLFTTGTWEPTCTAGTITKNFATYVKTASLILVQFDFVMPTSSSSGVAIVSGLPFPVAGSYSVGSFVYNSYASGAVAELGPGGLTFRANNSAGNSTFANVSGKRFAGSASYQT